MVDYDWVSVVKVFVCGGVGWLEFIFWVGNWLDFIIWDSGLRFFVWVRISGRKGIVRWCIGEWRCGNCDLIGIMRGVDIRSGLQDVVEVVVW